MFCQQIRALAQWSSSQMWNDATILQQAASNHVGASLLATLWGHLPVLLDNAVGVVTCHVLLNACVIAS
jgi:hypothetical protein